MNTFGRLFRLSLYGESHGKEVGIIIDGCPAGLALSTSDFKEDLERRRAGASGTTGRRELDKPRIKSGLFNRRTTGAPLTISFANRDVRSAEYLPLRDTPRPGHADFVARQKYAGFNDFRGGGQFSGRLTVALVAAGVVAKKIIHPATVKASLIEAGGIRDSDEAVRSASAEGDSVGGVVECRADGFPGGLGEPFFNSVESMISHIIFSIPGIKAIEFGSGFACSRMRGSECNDVLIDQTGKTKTNHSGGINGGMTNGNEIVFRVAARPTPSIRLTQQTINIKTGKTTNLSVKGRHDACIALRMPVIVEAAAAVVLADFLLIEHKRSRIMR